MNDPKSRFDDEKLKSFLKENQPIAPSASSDELAILLERLDLEPQRPVSEPLNFNSKTQRPFHFQWLALGGLMAAGLAAIWMNIAQPFSNHVASTPVSVSADEWDAIEAESEAENAELPAFDVGEEFLGLIAENGR